LFESIEVERVFARRGFEPLEWAKTVPAARKSQARAGRIIRVRRSRVLDQNLDMLAF
jgi:hypothetical protein